MTIERYKNYFSKKSGIIKLTVCVLTFTFVLNKYFVSRDKM